MPTSTDWRAWPEGTWFPEFVHRLDHLACRTGKASYPESALVTDCWGFPFAEPPAWAVELAVAGEPGRAWCPILCPDLSGQE